MQSSEGLLGASYVTLLACIYGEPRTPVQPHLTVRLSCFVSLLQAIYHIEMLVQKAR